MDTRTGRRPSQRAAGTAVAADPSELVVDVGRLVDGRAPTSIRAGATVLASHLDWPGDDLRARWDRLVGGAGPPVDGIQLGVRLFAAVFHDPTTLRLFHDTAATTAFLRLVVLTADPDVASLPWELLVDPTRGEYLTRSGSVVRWLVSEEAVPVPAPALEQDRPISALVVGASPPQAPLPSVAAELAAIEAAFAPAVAAGRALPPTVLPGVTRRSLADALREAQEAGRAIDVFHFSGHAGTPPGSDRPVLGFEGDDGLVTAEALARLLSGAGVRLAVLNGCGSLEPDGADATTVVPEFARELIERGVPAIVGMQEVVADEFAATLGGDLYAALLDGRTVDGAVTDVRRLIEDDETRAYDHFGIPVVYLAPGQGRLVAPPDTGSAWSWVRSHRWIVAAVTVVIPLLFTYLDIFDRVGEWLFPPPPPVMAGDFNVAVADFALGEGTEGDVPDLQTLDDSAHRELVGALTCDGSSDVDSAGLQFACLGPEDLGPVAGDTAEERATTVAELAAATRADVVLFGTITREGGLTVLRPELYVSDRQLGRAPELAGAHELEPIRGARTRVTQRVAFRAAVVDTAGDVAALVLALSHYADGSFEDSLAEVEQLAAGGGFALEPTLLDLARGNLHGRLGDPVAAEAAYRRVLAEEPGDADAMVGLGEVAYQAGLGDQARCQPGTIDDAGMQDAIAAYEQAIGLAEGDDGRIRANADFGLGRIAVCRSLAGEVDDWDEARRRLEDVVAAQQAAPATLVDAAAEAHSLLALLATRDATRAGDDAEDAWREVIAHADAAIALEPAGRDRIAHFVLQRATAEHALGRETDACASLAVAREDAVDLQLPDIDALEARWSC